MKAVELRIVFEDDDGRMYTQTLVGPPAEVAASFVTGSPSPSADLLVSLCGRRIPLPPVVGPVLRKTTEVEGSFSDLGDDGMIVSVRDGADDPGRGGCGVVDLEDLIPGDCLTVVGHDQIGYPRTEQYRFRFDVTAVRVPEVKP